MTPKVLRKGDEVRITFRAPVTVTEIVVRVAKKRKARRKRK